MWNEKRYVCGSETEGMSFQSYTKEELEEEIKNEPTAFGGVTVYELVPKFRVEIPVMLVPIKSPAKSPVKKKPTRKKK